MPSPVMMPGAPVADAVFADLEPRIKSALRDGLTTLGLGTILVGERLRERGLHPHEAEEGRRARVPLVAAHPPARRRDPGRRARRDPPVQRRPGRRRLPRAAPDAAADRLRRRAARDRPGQGRRRAAPGEHRPARAVDARPGVVHAGRASRRCSRTTRSRSPVARCASSAAAPRSAARSRSCSRRSARPRTPRSPSCTPACPTGRVHAARRRSWSPRRASPGSCSPSTSRPAAWWSAAGSATRAASCCPTSTSACEEVAGYITPRVGGVGPTTIAMLFRNAVEIAERNAGAA